MTDMTDIGLIYDWYMTYIWLIYDMLHRQCLRRLQQLSCMNKPPVDSMRQKCWNLGWKIFQIWYEKYNLVFGRKYSVLLLKISQLLVDFRPRRLFEDEDTWDKVHREPDQGWWAVWSLPISSPFPSTRSASECPAGSCGEPWVSFTYPFVLIWSCSGSTAWSRPR